VNMLDALFFIFLIPPPKVICKLLSPARSPRTATVAGNFVPEQT